MEKGWVANGDRPVAIWQPDAQLQTFLARQWRALPKENPLRGGSAAALRPASPPRRAAAPKFVKPPSPYLPPALLEEWEGDAAAAAMAMGMRAQAEQLRTPRKAHWTG